MLRGLCGVGVFSFEMGFSYCHWGSFLGTMMIVELVDLYGCVIGDWLD